jgi:hypothetical protein
MTYEATRDVPVNITFSDGTHTNTKAGRGFRVEQIKLGENAVGLVKGVWAGDVRSEVEIKQSHFQQAFVKVG